MDWEQALQGWQAALHDPDAHGGSDSSGDEFDFDSVTEDMAQQELGNMIVDLKHKGTLTAKDACILCWWAAKAGLKGLVADLAMRPDRPTGNFSKCFDRVMRKQAGGEDDDLYVMKVPSYRRATATRSHLETHVWPPHEAANDEIAKVGSPTMRALLEERRNTDALPPAYYEHEIVQRAPAGTPVYPYALYIDAVDFQRTDAIIGVWLCSLVTDCRHLCLAFRKSEQCCCGCRHWCTMHCIMSFLHWSCLHMARGRMPSERHDGTPLSAADGERRLADAGKDVGWRGVVLYLKSDMMEYVTTLGYPSWKSASPCPLCFCTPANMGDLAGISPVDVPWRTKTYEDYDAACRACEVWVEVTNADLFMTLRGSLEYDKRRTGNRGRCLQQDLRELGLKKGDRLQPGGSLHDVGDIDVWDPESACRLLFWRRSEETFVRNRNPLFSKETGIVPEAVLVVDWLHCLSLGVYKYFIAALWHALFQQDVFRVGSQNPEVLVAESVARLREHLTRWYESEAAAGRNHSRLSHLTVDMVSGQKIGTWGAETNGLLLFSAYLLERFEGELPAGVRRHFRRGSDSLVAIHTLIKENEGGKCQVAVAQAFADHVKEHLQAMRELEIEVRAKHHCLAHMVRKLLKYGTPALWACWRDESDNHQLAQLAARAHRLVWSRRVISEHRVAYGSRAAKRNNFR